MVGLHNLKSDKVQTEKRRVGRGGKRGKTSGRGHKGQKQHGGHGIRPELRDLIKKFPKRRGFGQNRSRTVNDSRVVYVPVNLDAIDKAFEAGDTVSLQTLLEKNLTKKSGGKIQQVKILARGKLAKKLVFEDIKMSKAAKKVIEKS